MLLDDTIKKVLEKVQIQVKKQLGNDISQEDLFDIIDSQFKIIPQAMSNEETVKLDKLGKFLIKDGRKDYLTKNGS